MKLYTSVNRCRRILVSTLGATALLTLTACADRSGTNLQAEVAESTLLLAKQANAQQLAPAEYSQASETVAAAQEAVATQDWKAADAHGLMGEAQATHTLYKAKTVNTRQRLESVTMLPIN